MPGLIGPRIYLVGMDLHSIVRKSFLIRVNLYLEGMVFNLVATHLYLDFFGKVIYLGDKISLEKSR